MTDLLWSKTPRVLFVTGNTPDICTLWRCWWPKYEMEARGYTIDFIKYGDLPTVRSMLEYGRYNTIVTPRMTFEKQEDEQGWIDFITPFRPQIKLWYDIDDDLLSEAFNARQAEVTVSLGSKEQVDDLLRRSDQQRQSRLRLIGMSDGVTIGSYNLAPLVTKLSRGPVIRVRNGINARFFQHNLNNQTRTVPYVTIGWSGGPRLDRDLDPLYEVWPEIARRNPNVHFMLQGWAPDKLASVLPPERVHVIGGVELDNYPSILKNIDIFCCVAPNDPFVKAKTPIKFFESALTGSAVVGSPDVYGPVINHGSTGFVATTNDEWIKYTEELLLDVDLRERMACNAKEHVLKFHTISQTYAEWLNAWSTTL